jgi:teichuronic acid biosynthesis glycosyltransferase TuaC
VDAAPATTHARMTSHAARPRLRVLILTKVFPNAAQPLAAAFNRQQFASLSRIADLDLLVPIQWFPGARQLGPRTEAGRLAAVPDFEWTEGMFVRHPRVFHLPRVDYPFAAGLYVASLLPLVRRLAARADVVLGSFVYPDGLAAAWMARLLGLPAVMYALGSDINVLPQIPGVRAMLRMTLPRTSRVVAVSRDLGDKLVGFGAPRERVVVVPNGVDRRLFTPRDRAEARRALGQPADGKMILYVGRVEPAKGVEDLLAAFALIAPHHPNVRLAIVGDGSVRAKAEKQAAALPGRILVPGGRPLDEVSRWMAACDLLTLPSWNEGTPNVVLEALASGRPVVATRVGGIPDLIDRPSLGELVDPRNPQALADALVRVLGGCHDPQAIARAGTVSWDESAERLHDVLAAAAGEPLP